MTPQDDEELAAVLEAALLAAGEPLSIDRLGDLFVEAPPSRARIERALGLLGERWREGGAELIEVSGGWRLQVRARFSPWISRLWEERPGRYSRALLETLALMAYRQPITRGEIEAIRGVAVSSNIVRTLLERGWVKVLGHREVPGRPALFGTTRTFLDHFGLKSLADLPPLAEPRDLDAMAKALDEVPN